MNFRSMLKAESVGQPECPLFYRWTLWDRWGFKVLLHHFMPNLADPDVHDHPRSFVTFVLRGGYLDRALDGRREVMSAPKVRYRRADHAHNTVTGSWGAWTLVVMGPLRRPWGFWRGGHWYNFDDYKELFGFARLCDTEEDK